jgi:hypothetical protein
MYDANSQRGTTEDGCRGEEVFFFEVHPVRMHSSSTFEVFVFNLTLILFSLFSFLLDVYIRGLTHTHTWSTKNKGKEKKAPLLVGSDRNN